MWCATRFSFGSAALLTYINDMPQAVDSELLLYANDTSLAFPHKDIKTIGTSKSRCLNFS